MLNGGESKSMNFELCHSLVVSESGAACNKSCHFNDAFVKFEKPDSILALKLRTYGSRRFVRLYSRFVVCHALCPKMWNAWGYGKIQRLPLKRF